MSDSSAKDSSSSNHGGKLPPKDTTSQISPSSCNTNETLASNLAGAKQNESCVQADSKGKQKDEGPIQDTEIRQRTETIKDEPELISSGEAALKLDIKKHSTRKEGFLSTKIRSISAHFDRISSGVERAKRRKEQKHQKVKKKLESSSTLREKFLTKRKKTASATGQRVTNPGDMHSYSKGLITHENERFVFANSAKVKEFVSGQQNIARQIQELERKLPDVDLEKNQVKAEDIWRIFSKFALFADFSEQYKNMDLKSMFKLFVSEKIRNGVKIIFEQMRESLSAKYADITLAAYSTFVEARSFLYSLTMLVENHYHKNAFRVPTYAVRLENDEPFYLFQTLRRNGLEVKNQFLSNRYYDYIVSYVLEKALSLWNLFSEILLRDHDEEATKKLMNFFYEHFETEFIKQFQVFRFLNMLRNAASLIEVIRKLDSHLEYLKLLKDLADGDAIINQYCLTIKECKTSILTNKMHFEEFRKRTLSVRPLPEILELEKFMYLKYKTKSEQETSAGLTEIRCSTGSSPFGKRDSSNSHNYSGYSSSLSQPTSQNRAPEWGIPLLLIPPTFSLLQWRQCIIKIYLDYYHDVASNEQNVLSTLRFLKTGHIVRRKPSIQYLFNSPNARNSRVGSRQNGEKTGFSKYLAEKYVADVESLREWLSLKTFNEGVMETVEKLSHMPSVNSMLVDVVQIVERCMRALMIVADGILQSKIAIVGGPHDVEKQELIALISNASTALSLIDDGSINIDKYFSTALHALRGEAPKFLAQQNAELQKLIDAEKIDGTFVQRFIELIRDYMIHGINKFVSECLVFVSDRVKNFEVTMFDNTHGSTSIPLDLRLPILFNIFLQVQQDGCETPTTSGNNICYTFFNRIFIHLMCCTCPAILELPEPTEAFSIQFEKLHSRIRSFILSQSLLVLLVTYFGQEPLIGIVKTQGTTRETRKALFDFQELFNKMESFLTDHFDESGMYSVDEFVKLQIIRIIKETCGSGLTGVTTQDRKQIVELNIDTNVIMGLIDQSVKVNINADKANATVASVYTKTISNVFQLVSNNGKAPSAAETEEEYSKLIGQFYRTDNLEELVTNIVVDYYEIFNLFYGIYQESLKGLWMNFKMQIGS